MSNFKNYAEYYNLLYKDKNYKEEVDYIENLLKNNSNFPIQTILNLGCGTGNHDAFLAEKKYQITGVDLSPQMIEIAKNQNIEKAEFVEGDVRTINLNKEFDAVISLFHVASYQTKNDDFDKFLQTAYKHLKKDGIFVFDFWYGAAVLSDNPVVRVKRMENENLKVTRIAEPEILFNENIVDVNFEIIIESKQNNQAETIKEQHKMRYWFLPELEMFLEKNNFEIEKELSWFTNDKLNQNSWYGVIIARKK